MYKTFCSEVKSPRLALHTRRTYLQAADCRMWYKPTTASPLSNRGWTRTDITKPSHPTSQHPLYVFASIEQCVLRDKEKNNISCSIIKCHSLVLNNMFDSSSTTLQALFFFYSSGCFFFKSCTSRIQNIKGQFRTRLWKEKVSALFQCVPTMTCLHFHTADVLMRSFSWYSYDFMQLVVLNSWRFKETYRHIFSLNGDTHEEALRIHQSMSTFMSTRTIPLQHFVVRQVLLHWREI